MKSLYTVLLVFLFANNQIFAQCEKCKMLDDDMVDFCFTMEEFDAFCMQFGTKSTSYQLKGDKKIKSIPIGVAGDYEYLKMISSDKKLKLSAAEIVFIQAGLAAWKVEERKFGYKYEDSGLGIKIYEEGEGELPVAGEPVQVHYSGFLEDGTKFDSSVDRGRPFKFTLGEGQVIKGWDEGVSKLKIGTKAWLRIPPDLGYGSIARGPIPANAVLYFEIEVLE